MRDVDSHCSSNGVSLRHTYGVVHRHSSRADTAIRPAQRPRERKCQLLSGGGSDETRLIRAPVRIQAVCKVVASCPAEGASVRPHCQEMMTRALAYKARKLLPLENAPMAVLSLSPWSQVG